MTSGLGLALSGGGFRATLFHLGVVRYLRDAGALPKVSHISAVSGGSILAAHMVLNWDRYTGDDAQFESAAAEIVHFVQFDVRNHIMRRLPLQAPLRWLARLTRRSTRPFTPNATLERYYRQFLFGDRCMHELPENPRLHILTTSVSHGGLSVFNRDGLFIQQRDQSGQATFHHSSDLLAGIPRVVAASSAFPAFFPPVEINAADLGVREGQMTTEYFTDGGVYDNLGLRAFNWLSDQDTSFERILVSDAGKPFQVLSEATLGLISRSIRATDILWDRVWQLERENFGSQERFLFFSIIDSVDSSESASALHPVVQPEVATIRTDLDRFSDLEVNALMQHGYAVAQKHYSQEVGDAQAQGVNGWNPLAEMPGTGEAATRIDGGAATVTRQARKLRRSSQRRVWSTLFDWRDWPSYLFLVVAIVLFGLLPYRLYEFRQHAQLQSEVIDAITRGNPEFATVLDLLDQPPESEWAPQPVEQRDTPLLADYSNVELLSHTRIMDLRHAPLAKSDPATGWVHLHDRLAIQNPGNAAAAQAVTVPYFISEGEASFRHLPSSTLRSIARIAEPVELYGAKQVLYEVTHDLSILPAGASANVALEMRASVDQPVNEAGFVIQVKTDLLSIWLLFPTNHPYRDYSLIRYPADRSSPPDIVESRYTIDHPKGSLIGWSVVNPELDYIYETRWEVE